MATRRLIKENKDIIKDPPSTCSAGPIGDDLFYWQGNIIGPPDTPYAGGIFNLDIKIPSNYPFEPPKVKFRTKVYHPNIDSDGNICLDILKDKWTPVLSIIQVILSISSLLTDPNPSDPLMPDIAYQYTNNIEQFKVTARKYTQQFAM